MSRFLDECAEFLRDKPYSFIRISEIRDGGAPETREFTRTYTCLNTYSVAKMYTMTAIGLLFDRGLIRPEDRICDLLRDELPASGMDARWEISTVDTALRHRIGLPRGFLDIDVNRSSTFTDDFLTYMLTYPLDYTPGEGYAYTDGAYYLLARIAEKKAGMPLDSFLWRELFLPLGYQEAAWSHCPRGHVMGATGLYLHSADMVKLGCLYLSGGTWQGRRILSREWVDTAVARGYSLNRNAGGSFGKGGMYGQYILVIPAQGRVIAMQSFGGSCDDVIRFAEECRE